MRVEKVKTFIRKMQDNEEGGWLISFPFTVMIFIIFTAMIFNMAMLLMKRQQLQITADCVSRAGTLAVEEQYAVLEGNGKYHVYTQLDPSLADSYGQAVLNEHERYYKGLEIEGYVFNPDGEAFTVPYWNSRNYRYDDKALTSDDQYYNGDFSILMGADMKGAWTDLLGISRDKYITIYSTSSARGSASKR